MVEKRNILEKFLTEGELKILFEAYKRAETEESPLKKRAIYESIKNVESMCRFFELFPTEAQKTESTDVLAQRINVLKALLSNDKSNMSGFQFITNNGLPKFLNTLEVMDRFYYGDVQDLLNKIKSRRDNAKTIDEVGKIKINRAKNETIQILYGVLKEYLILISAQIRTFAQATPTAGDINRMIKLKESDLTNPIHNDYMKMVESQLDLYGYDFNPMEIELPTLKK